MAEEKLTYESAYEELEGIMEALQNDEIGVDEPGSCNRPALHHGSPCNA
jgi:exonuclease VII small subunit